MKQLQYVTLIIFVCFLSDANAQHKKYTVKLVDRYGTGVGFFLLGDKSTVLRSNSSGVLELTKSQVRKHKNEMFTFHFSHHLAYMLYRTNLYTHKYKNISDKYMKAKGITIAQLTENKDTIFYLRRKEIRLDDDGFFDVDTLKD